MNPRNVTPEDIEPVLDELDDSTDEERDLWLETLLQICYPTLDLQNA